MGDGVSDEEIHQEMLDAMVLFLMEENRMVGFEF
jgi:hypothetical protein